MTILKFATAILLMATGLSAATDPFVGKWKWSSEKSPQPTIAFSVKDAGDNRYAVAFNGNDPITLTADGASVESPNGGSTSLKNIDEHTWEMVRILGGKYVRGLTISSDEKTLIINQTAHLLNGTTANATTIYKRMGGDKGLVGEWQSVSFKTDNVPVEMIIEPFKKNGLTFYTPYDKWQVSMNFDGKKYSEQGPDVPKGTTSSGKRIDARTIQYASETNGKLDNSGEYKLSEDGRTLTITSKAVKESKPFTNVYDRQ
jgi:hypothetical protein